MKLIPKAEKIWCGENTYGTQHNMHLHGGPQETNHFLNTQQPKHTHAHTTHKTENNILHHHHGPPKAPASNGSNFTDECNHHTSRNQSRSLQHGDVLFVDDTNFSFINLTIILCAAAQRAH